MMKKLLLNKKANFADIPVFIMTSLVIAIGLLLTLVIISQFNDNIQLNDAVPNQTKTGINTYFVLLETTSDYILPIIYLGFLAFSIFAARLIPSSPKFMIIGVLAMIFLPFTAMIIENVWDGFIQQTIINQIANGLIFTPFILNNLVYVTLFYTILVNVALFTKEDLNK